jgi:hypothetical protein
MKLLLLIPIIFLTACSQDPDCFSDHAKVTVQEYVSEITYNQAVSEGLGEEFKDITITLDSFRFKGRDEQTKQVWCEAVVAYEYKGNPATHRNVEFTVELTEDPMYHYFNVMVHW